MDIAQMRRAASETAAVLRSLSHPDRLMLLCQLSQGEHSVGELEALLDIQQPNLSQHLGVLRAERLVDTRRDGKRIFYTVKDPKVLHLLSTLYLLYCPRS